jgi:hypothetical protein
MVLLSLEDKLLVISRENVRMNLDFFLNFLMLAVAHRCEGIGVVGFSVSSMFETHKNCLGELSVDNEYWKGKTSLKEI